MAQRRLQSGNRLRDRWRLSQGQAALLLCLFLAVRGLVPAGFMPAPLGAGGPYGLCHGNGDSAMLLQWLQREYHQHHGGHHHDDATAHSFADNHCNFSAAAGLAAAPSAELQLFFGGVMAPPPAAIPSAAHRRAYALPHSRAPPVSPIV